MAPNGPPIGDAVILKSIRQNCTNAVCCFLLPHIPTDLATFLTLYQQYNTGRTQRFNDEESRSTANSLMQKQDTKLKVLHAKLNALIATLAFAPKQKPFLPLDMLPWGQELTKHVHTLQRLV